jgi:hypothetical protein
LIGCPASGMSLFLHSSSHGAGASVGTPCRHSTSPISCVSRRVKPVEGRLTYHRCAAVGLFLDRWSSWVVVGEQFQVLKGLFRRPRLYIQQLLNRA